MHPQQQTTAMAESRFELQFSGELVPGADLRSVRARLGDLFKLPPEALELMFSGQTVVIKRGLDGTTAARYRDAFWDAGAILHLKQTQTEGLTLAPPGADVEEPVPQAGPQHIDTSYLSLVPGRDWNLEDCTPPRAPIPSPDTSGLTLAPAEPFRFRVPTLLDD
jgi:hypothetical protein